LQDLVLRRDDDVDENVIERLRFHRNVQRLDSRRDGADVRLPDARNNHVAPGLCKSVEFTARGDDTAVYFCIKERERKKCAITTRVSGALARVVASIFSTRARLSLQKRSRAKRYINFASVQFQSGARRRRRRKKATERCEREKTYITRAEERTMCLGRRRSSKPLFIYLCLCVVYKSKKRVCRA